MSDLLEDILSITYALSGFNIEATSKSLGIDRYWFMRNRVLKTRRLVSYPDFDFGSVIGALEDSILIQTWINCGYSFSGSAKILDISVNEVYRVIYEIYNAEYVRNKR